MQRKKLTKEGLDELRKSISKSGTMSIVSDEEMMRYSGGMMHGWCFFQTLEYLSGYFGNSNCMIHYKDHFIIMQIDEVRDGDYPIILHGTPADRAVRECSA